MTRLRGALLLSIAAGILTRHLAGQQAPVGPVTAGGGAPQATPRAEAAHLRALLTGIHLQTTFRVRIAGGSRVSGRYGGMVGDTIRLGTRTTQLDVPAKVIDSLWTRHQPIALTAIRGGLLGGLLAATVTLGRTFRISCRSATLAQFPDCHTTAGNVGRAAGMGALAGAAAGAVIGATFPKWKLRLP